MGYKTFEISNYVVKLGQNLSFLTGGKKCSGYISCQGQTERLIILFIAEGEVISSPTTVPNLSYGTIHIPIKEMPNYVDLLRNEAPIYGYLNSDNPEWNSITTSNEDVGEGE